MSTILIIEDDADNARSMHEVADDAGFTVIDAATGKAGVELFNAHFEYERYYGASFKAMEESWT